MGGGSEARALLREPMCVGFAADALGDVPSVDTCTLLEVCGFGAVTGDLLREVAEAGPRVCELQRGLANSASSLCAEAMHLGFHLGDSALGPGIPRREHVHVRWRSSEAHPSQALSPRIPAKLVKILGGP